MTESTFGSVTVRGSNRRPRYLTVILDRAEGRVRLDIQTKRAGAAESWWFDAFEVLRISAFLRRYRGKADLKMDNLTLHRELGQTVFTFTDPLTEEDPTNAKLELEQSEALGLAGLFDAARRLWDFEAGL